MSVIYAKRVKILWYVSLQKYIFNAEYRKKITQKCKNKEEDAKLHKSVIDDIRIGSIFAV